MSMSGGKPRDLREEQKQISAAMREESHPQSADIGASLREARLAKGWSQGRAVWELTRLAQQKNVKVATAVSLKTQFSRWENGHIAPDFYRPLLRELFGVAFDRLKSEIPPGTSTSHVRQATSVGQAMSGSGTGQASARGCAGCGRPLSRYNTERYCQACHRQEKNGCSSEAALGSAVKATSLGARLRELRNMRGMTLNVLADFSGLSESFLSMVERGQRPLSRYSDIVALASALRVPPADLAPGLSANLVEARPETRQQHAGAEGGRMLGYLPSEVLTRPDFTAACASRDLGRIFTIANKWGGAGFTVSHIARRCEMTIGQVQDYIKRGRKAHSLGIFERVADGLHIPGEMLGVGRRQWEGKVEDGSPIPEFQPKKTRLWHPDGLAVSTVFNGDDEERLILAARSPRRRDPGAIDALSAILSGERRLEDSIGAASLVNHVKAQLEIVTDLVMEARGNARAKVLDIGSQWAQFAGWLHANTGQIAEANKLYNLALAWATEVDKPNMIATALNMQGHTAWLSAKAGPMIGLSRAAQGYKSASPGVRALAIQQEARGIALSGEAGISDIDRKLDQAEMLVAEATANPEVEPPWIYFFSPDYLVMQRGIIYRLLGEYGKAIELIEQGLSAMPSEMRSADWVASHYLLQLAFTYAKSGDIDAACRLGKEINDIIQSTRSERLSTDAIRLHEYLNYKYPNRPDVIELSEALC